MKNILKYGGAILAAGLYTLNPDVVSYWVVFAGITIWYFGIDMIDFDKDEDV